MSCVGGCVHSQWLDRYLARRMDDVLIATFEEHLKDCRTCLDALEFERRVRRQNVISRPSFVSRCWH
jgi:hypothetical protein